MLMRDISSTDFLLIENDLSADEALEMLDKIQPTMFVVNTPVQDSYLIATELITEQLKQASKESTQQSLIDVISAYKEEYEIAEVVDAQKPIPDDLLPERAIVKEDGLITGVIAPEYYLNFDGFGNLLTNRLGGDFRTGKTGDVRQVLGDKNYTTDINKKFLNAQFPDKIRLNTQRSLLLTLTNIIDSDAFESLPEDIPDDETLRVIIHAKNGLEVVGQNETDIRYAKDGDDPVRFNIKATSPGVANLKIQMFLKTTIVASIKLTPQIVTQLSEPNDVLRDESANVVHPISQGPDLLFLINEDSTNGKPTLTYNIITDKSSELDNKRFGPIELQKEPSDIFNTFFKEINGLKTKTEADRDSAINELNSKGNWLFESLFPKELRDLIWIHQHDIKSVQIISDEPWIPWELCRLNGENDLGQIEEGEFFCEAFELSRWISNASPRADEIKLDKLAVIAPTNTGLPYPIKEREYLENLEKTKPIDSETIDPQYYAVIDMFNQGIYNGIHFAGHGTFNTDNSNASFIELEDDKKLTALAVSGKAKNLGLAKPLVFLNACQVGRNDYSLTNIGGWAGQFLRAGAAAFIGTYWNVNDKTAYDFATNFYDYLLDGHTLAESALYARKEAKKSGDPSYLAYTVFGMPTARIQKF